MELFCLLGFNSVSYNVRFTHGTLLETMICLIYQNLSQN